MADGENRTMNTVETTGAEPARTTLAVNTGAFQLLQ
jgi:hypothetical protein